ncbi:Beta-glucuronidase [Gryllus bimaculatus]|nr:Beta-glucuronidase [Gryllus bimaculatus]
MAWASWLAWLACAAGGAAGMLFPRESESREVVALDGIWRFALGGREEVDVGFRQRWYLRELPKWVNGHLAGNHSGGHLPFDLDVTALLEYDAPSLLTVAVNNTLSPHTIPQGFTAYFNDTDMYPPGYTVNDYTFDFFNYAGIHRSVVLHTVPDVFINDITINTKIIGETGVVQFDVSYTISENEVDDEVSCKITLLEESNKAVGEVSLCEGDIIIDKAKFWWPVHMSNSAGHLYLFEVQLNHGQKRKDVYRLPVGIRTINWNETTVLLNNKPMYMYGFGKHEDSILRGKGLDHTLLVRDYSLIEWIGANSYRTSHYPYAEEALDLADRQGILIIAESPAVNLDNFDSVLLEKHKSVMAEMVNRDKNHPCVIMWSISNEARTQRKEAGPYYKSIVEYVKSLDKTRPVGFVTNRNMYQDKAAPFMDVIGVNRYFSWYSDTGDLELVSRQVETEYTKWHNVCKKPIFMSEYGADTISGFHQLPSFVWTEDYQVDLLHEHFKAFDNLRKKGFFIGEMVWNFADFATKQSVTRAQGNKKGIFTRERQPKHAAYVLKTRYHHLAKEQLKNMTE